MIRLVFSDLHLGTGMRQGEPNPLEDFHHDEAFDELLTYYEALHPDGIELIFNGDIFDLLKVKIGGVWPIEITDAIAQDKLRQCLDGHPRFVAAIKRFLNVEGHNLVFLPGNHDLDMWFKGPQEVLRRYICPPEHPDRLQFVTSSDAYYLPDGIQIRHGHQFERVHTVDYQKMTTTTKDGVEILALPWGSLWILEVMNKAKEERAIVDRIQPLSRYILTSLFFDTRFVLRFVWNSSKHFVRTRIFNIRAWRERIRAFFELVQSDIVELFLSFDDECVRRFKKMRGVRYLIVGHSHGPRYRRMDDGRILVNTGTWMKMINVDVTHLGQDSGLTYCVIDYDDRANVRVSLLRWKGIAKPFELIPYAD